MVTEGPAPLAKPPVTSAASSLLVIIKNRSPGGAERTDRRPGIVAAGTQGCCRAAVADPRPPSLGILLTDPALFAKDEVEKPTPWQRESTHWRPPMSELRKRRREIPEISFQPELKCYLDVGPKRWSLCSSARHFFEPERCE